MERAMQKGYEYQAVCVCVCVCGDVKLDASPAG